MALACTPPSPSPRQSAASRYPAETVKNNTAPPNLGGLLYRAISSADLLGRVEWMGERGPGEGGVEPQGATAWISRELLLQQTAGSRQRAADSGQQTAGSRQRAADSGQRSRQQTAGSRHWTAGSRLAHL
ncbi:hypothetical protein T492DRAFT_1114451 [Pavlovales sp. CCMP2436]|nr:hypothetical protein T492DRAFT_1114451 [Pavlovales sp. CCMP2436]